MTDIGPELREKLTELRAEVARLDKELSPILRRVSIFFQQLQLLIGPDDPEQRDEA